MITTAAFHQFELEMEAAAFLESMSKYAGFDKNAQLLRLLSGLGSRLGQRVGYRLALRGMGSRLGRLGVRTARLPGSAADVAGATRTAFNPATRAVTTPIRTGLVPPTGSILTPGQNFMTPFAVGPIERAVLAQRAARGGIAARYGQILPGTGSVVSRGPGAFAGTVFAPRAGILPPVPRIAPAAPTAFVSPGSTPSQIMAATPPPMAGEATGIGIQLPV